MKKIITTFLGASLLAGAVYAQDSFEGFYPAENDDTPDYLVNNHVKKTNAVQSSAKSSLSDSTLTAFYPAEDDDTPDYLLDNNVPNQSNTLHAAKSAMNNNVLCAIYPDEDSDTPSYLKSC